MKVPTAEMVKAYEGAGLPIELAEMLAGLEDMTAQGLEERLSDVVEKTTGTKGRRFVEMVQENVEVWEA